MVSSFIDVFRRTSKELQVQAHDLRRCEIALNNAVASVSPEKRSEILEDIQSMDRVIQSLDAISEYLLAIQGRLV